MFYIGCHLSKKKGMLIMAEAAASIGAKAIQFFTRNPRGGHEKAIDPRDLQRFNVFTKEHGIKYLLAYETARFRGDGHGRRPRTA